MSRPFFQIYTTEIVTVETAPFSVIETYIID